MSTPSAGSNPYDDVPYPSQAVPHTHPDRLAAIATLFGVQPTWIDRCRVLELGCATGGNLIPMADRHPESRFIGIDYARGQIETAQRAADALGLANIELRDDSIADLGAELGKFDYIICHGVYSWVAPPVRDKILPLCRSLLAPQGVAYVSYNIYPGWHLRETIRQLLVRRASGGTSQERLANARALLQFLSTALAAQDSPDARLQKSHIDTALGQPDGHLFHEDLEKDNTPVYFHEFAARAAAAGLQYLGDTALATMFVSSFLPLIEQRVREFGDDVVSVEQHLDVLRNRPFRQTLLCHREVPLSRQITVDPLRKVHLCGWLRPTSATPDLKSAAPEKFAGPFGMVISASAPAVKAALFHLATQWPRAIPIDELIAAAEKTRGDGSPLPQAERHRLCESFVTFLMSGLIDPTSAPDDFVTAVSRRPQASRMARLEALSSAVVTNRRHQPVALNDATRHVVRYLDGEHDHEALVRELGAALDRGDVSILIGGIPAIRGPAVSNALEEMLSQCLSMLAKNSLLVA